MVPRRIVFYPARGEPNSPADFINAIEDKDEQELLRSRLKLLSVREPFQWSFGWCKHYNKIYQLRTDKHRLILYVENEELVVLHAFKKQSKGTEKTDINRWKKHLKSYLDAKKK
jgi:hypothetical protein